MALSLRDRMKATPGATAPPTQAASIEREAPVAASLDVDDAGVDVGESDLVDMIAGLEVEAVVGGVLQRISFKAGVNPAEVGAILKTLDANVKVRDAFPSKFGGGGGRDTKLARCVNVLVRVTDSGKFIDLVCQNGEDITVSVSKKNADGFADALRALGKLHEKNLAKVQKAFAEKGNATVVVMPDEQFGVKYWTTDDGKNFLEEMVAEPPAAVEGGES